MPSDRICAKTRILSWVLFLIYSVFVYNSAILPPYKIPSFLLHVNDKLIHGMSYFLLFGTAVLAFKNTERISLRVLPENGALVYCALMGIFTEMSQIFVPGRSCNAADWSSDVLGAVLGLLLYRFYISRRKKI